MSDEPVNGPLSAKLLLGMGIVMFAIGQSLLFIIVNPLARTVGLNELAFGAAMSLASITLIIGSPFWGRRSDVIGRKPVFLIGMTGSAVGTLLVALVLQAGLNGWLTATGVLVALVIARATYGLVASAIYPAATAYMADITDFRTRGQGMAIIGAANGMGGILAPLLGAALAFAGVLVPMYAAAAIGLAGALLSLLYLPEPRRAGDRKPSPRMAVFDRRILPYMIMWGVFFMTFMAVQFITAFYIQDRLGVTEPRAIIQTAAWLLMGMTLFIVVVQISVLQIFRVPPRILLRMFGPIFVLALLVMSVSTGFWMLLGGFALLGLAFACATPGLNGCASLSVTPQEQGSAAGLLSAANTVGAICGPVAGVAAYQLAPNAPMLFGAGALFLVSLLAFWVKAP
ncbi:MAG: MFS transporter [Chromatiales bacterium]|nr:MFS transporter [Chromatiales bacterium]